MVLAETPVRLQAALLPWRMKRGGNVQESTGQTPGMLCIISLTTQECFYGSQPIWILTSSDGAGLEMATLSQSLCEIDFLLLFV